MAIKGPRNLCRFFQAIAWSCVFTFCLQGVASPNKGIERTKLQEKTVAESRLRFLNALFDFQFIGSAANGATVETNVPIKPQDSPREFKRGTQYVWLKKGYGNNEVLFKSLQDRLRAEGVTILKASALSTRFIGGLVFTITFKDGDYVGTLSNQLDTRIVKSKKLHRQWGFDDYVLVFEATP